MERVKSKIDAMGMDNVSVEHLEELKAWTCIAKDIAEYDYYYHITEAMEKPENEYGVNYDEHGKYYTQPRMSNGQFRTDMRRRGYDEMYDRTPMYYEDMNVRDNRMYYTTSDVGLGSSIGASNMSTSRGYSESRYDMARRGYEEAKKMNPSTDNMEKIQDVFEVLKSDMKEIKPKMTPAEKTFARTELTNMANSMV